MTDWTEEQKQGWQEVLAVCGITQPLAEMYAAQMTPADAQQVCDAMRGVNRIATIRELLHELMERGKATVDAETTQPTQTPEVTESISAPEVTESISAPEATPTPEA